MTLVTEQPEGILETLRRAEVEIVRQLFRPGMRVLEIGGGSGFQASIIAAWGCVVTSIDIADRPPPRFQYYPVLGYDGTHIPYPDGSYDAVFSSNVLEHVKGLRILCADMRRVLAPDGVSIHYLPTPTWRFWTSVAHYPHLMRRVFGRLRGTRVADASTLDDGNCPRRSATLLRTVIFPGPHGEYSSALAELYYFRKRRWLNVLRESGLEVIQADVNGIFYTGYALLPGLTMRTRRLASRFLGSSCFVFVMRAK